MFISNLFKFSRFSRERGRIHGSAKNLICGSDLRIMSDGNSRISPPQILGHEIAGEIVELGEGVKNYSLGDRVSTGADIPCGKCNHCKSGRPNCCDTNLAIGYQFECGF